ncbi:uncharacterized protein LOC114580163 [Dendrobium catenatum]|uniref:uncharacterized protein LOC114580163 n=1 Tax=Dendrobium catenatum TaxID=906689 RepID=UPI0010A01438|nr:uncharacterized protein LOC114580163 [Dendrobium catenatum]
MEVLNKKCKRALNNLYYWSKFKLKDFSTEKESLKVEILQIQEDEAREGKLDNEKLWLLRSKVKKLNVILNCLNTWWKQRAKVKLVEEGDSNTKFFHVFANGRRNANWIYQVKNASGRISEDPREVEEIFLRFFQRKWRYRSCSLVLLEKEISVEEVKEAVMRLGNNKAPGCDGLTHSFFKGYWEIIEGDVCKAVTLFFSSGKMCKEWKDTLVVLIPKMIMVIPKIISEEQVAFVKGRSISDHLLLAQEFFNKLRFSKAVSRRKRKISKLLGIKLEEELEYLGIKISLRRLRIVDFQILLDKSLKRLNAWGNRFISLAGKLMLVKSVLLALPNFLIAHSLVLKRILYELERYCRDFIWHKMDGSRGLHYVSWEVLCRPKQCGEWGVHAAFDRMGPLRAKFAWNIMENPNSLFNRNVLAKYGDNWWKMEEARGGSNSWKILMSGWKVLKNFLRWKVVNGANIDVLKEGWIMDKSLLKWPTFVGNLEVDDIKLNYFIDNGNLDFSKLRNCFGENLVRMIEDVQIFDSLHEDQMELKLHFMGKSLSALLMESKYKYDLAHDDITWIHKLNINDKVKLFLWRICTDVIPTEVFLFKRRISGNILCPIGVGDLKLLLTAALQIGFRCAEMIAAFVISFYSSSNQGVYRSDHWDAYRSEWLLSDYWHPPPPEWLKLNLDASLKENYDAGLGGVLRDDKGRFIFCFWEEKKALGHCLYGVISFQICESGDAIVDLYS